MSELGSFEAGMPSEDGGQMSEAAREQLREQFKAAQAAIQQLQQEEKKAKKRDDNVAHIILQFLTDTQRTHLATLIARLVARNCPSTFVLAILSLVNDNCRIVVEEYLKEQNIDLQDAKVNQTIIPKESILTMEANEHFALWIVRIEYVMGLDAENILDSLLLDDQNIDGTILQLMTFVLQEYLTGQQKNASFDQLQSLSGGILQALFHPAMQARGERA